MFRQLQKLRKTDERFLILTRSRSAGIAALFQTESDTVRGKKIRRDRNFCSGRSTSACRRCRHAQRKSASHLFLHLERGRFPQIPPGICGRKPLHGGFAVVRNENLLAHLSIALERCRFPQIPSGICGRKPAFVCFPSRPGRLGLGGKAKSTAQVAGFDECREGFRPSRHPPWSLLMVCLSRRGMSN